MFAVYLYNAAITKSSEKRWHNNVESIIANKLSVRLMLLIIWLPSLTGYQMSELAMLNVKTDTLLVVGLVCSRSNDCIMPSLIMHLNIV